MRILLDTHVLLWWLSENRSLRNEARAAIEAPENDVLVSVATLWEIVIKVRIGKLVADVSAVERAIDEGGMRRLAISPGHLRALAALPTFHRDPFDHLLVAQAVEEDATLVSSDAALSPYPVRIMPA